MDVRGSGDSDGLMADEYQHREQDDALEVIAWIAARPWCDGNVGMTGISWGGFNSLQVAARRPAALKAIITLCSSDDRYADDAHYMGGCLINENLTWGAVLLCSNALPPDPEIVGERWQAMWRDRLENAVLFPELWLHHPVRDEYWKHGSVCEDYGAIQCAVYAIGGWADAYRNAVPRLLEGLHAPRKGLIGPWCHAFPHDSFQAQALVFFGKPCAGGITGSRAWTPASWTSRNTGSGCRNGCRPAAIRQNGRGDGWRRPSGRRPGSGSAVCFSIPGALHGLRSRQQPAWRCPLRRAQEQMPANGVHSAVRGTCRPTSATTTPAHCCSNSEPLAERRRYWVHRLSSLNSASTVR